MRLSQWHRPGAVFIAMLMTDVSAQTPAFDFAEPVETPFGTFDLWEDDPSPWQALRRLQGRLSAATTLLQEAERENNYLRRELYLARQAEAHGCAGAVAPDGTPTPLVPDLTERESGIGNADDAAGRAQRLLLDENATLAGQLAQCQSEMSWARRAAAKPGESLDSQASDQPGSAAEQMPAAKVRPFSNPATVATGAGAASDMADGALYAVEAPQLPLGEWRWLDGVTFEAESALLPSQGLPVLDVLAQWLLEHPAARVEVRGHIDAQGEAPRGASLFRWRASAVRDYLLSHGVSAAQVRLVELTADGPREQPLGSVPLASVRRLR